MRIAFADFLNWDYHPQTVDSSPLGGTQSAACYLARALARLGHEVFLINSSTSPGHYDGVVCLSWGQNHRAMLQGLKLDVIITLLGLENGLLLREILGPKPLLILWSQDAHDQPSVRQLSDPRMQAPYDGFAMVSQWQLDLYHQSFGIDRPRLALMRNAIAPAFTHLFGDHETILSQKLRPPVLAYTSTPYRGLKLLLDAFAPIRSAVPNATLQVFSSMKVYQASPAADEDAHGALYQRCRQMEGVEYIGSVPQPELARRLRGAALLAYPNTFPETSCISAMEAMATGCRVITSELGALPETTAGFARLIKVGPDYLPHFIEQTIQSLRECDSGSEAMEQELQRQVAQINEAATWPVRAHQWLEWISRLAARRGEVQGRSQAGAPGPALTVRQAVELAFSHHQAGQLAEAEVIYRQVLAADPREVDALHMLGMLVHQTGRHELAASLIRQSIHQRPNDPNRYSNLSKVLRALGLVDDSIAAGRTAIQLSPDSALAHNNLGNVYEEAGRLEDAKACYRRALQLQPDFAEAHYNLGNILKQSGLLDEAIAAYQRAIALKPDLAAAHNNLGQAFRDQGELDAEIASFRRPLELEPDSATACNNLGSALKDAGQLDESIACYRRAMALEPQNPLFHSNLLITLLLHPSYDDTAIGQELKRWNQQFAEPLRSGIHPHLNTRNPERRLRIGYVSPDFRDHVVGRNVLPVLERHDHKGFDLFCYSGVTQPDAITERFEKASDGWRNIAPLSDPAAADLIRADGIDILIDLSLHTLGHRLTLFARKPAPVQATWAGYPGLTGLSTIDYRITDPSLDPPGASNAVHAERPMRLPHSFWCYVPIEGAPPVNSLPALTEGNLTFGSLNSFCKINAKVIDLWAEIMRAVKGSRLALLTEPGSHRERTAGEFERRSVAANRIDWFPRRSPREYLSAYHRLDLGLDTFPYNGHTTSLDSAWMGVPVVTLAGATIVSRAGLSQATNLGLPELIASTPQDFVQKAIALASDLPRLALLRQTLRDRMHASPLMDAAQFTRNLESAYRKMWHTWCETGTANR